MMMKIFGVALIVSGGFLIGKLRSDHMASHLSAISGMAALFREFDGKLREHRCSFEDAFLNKSDLAMRILEQRPIDGLSKTEEEHLAEHLAVLKTASYREALEANQAFITQLDELEEVLIREQASAGKALPMVTATIGLFIAVMLF